MAIRERFRLYKIYLAEQAQIRKLKAADKLEWAIKQAEDLGVTLEYFAENIFNNDEYELLHKNDYQKEKEFDENGDEIEEDDFKDVAHFTDSDFAHDPSQDIIVEENEEVFDATAPYSYEIFNGHRYRQYYHFTENEQFRNYIYKFCTVNNYEKVPVISINERAAEFYSYLTDTHYHQDEDSIESFLMKRSMIPAEFNLMQMLMRYSYLQREEKKLNQIKDKILDTVLTRSNFFNIFQLEITFFESHYPVIIKERIIDNELMECAGFIEKLKYFFFFYDKNVTGFYQEPGKVCSILDSVNERLYETLGDIIIRLAVTDGVRHLNRNTTVVNKGGFLYFLFRPKFFKRYEYADDTLATDNFYHTKNDFDIRAKIEGQKKASKHRQNMNAPYGDNVFNFLVHTIFTTNGRAVIEPLFLLFDTDHLLQRSIKKSIQSKNFNKLLTDNHISKKIYAIFHNQFDMTSYRAHKKRYKNYRFYLR